MTAHLPEMEALRSLLHRAPDAQGWGRLCKLLGGARWDRTAAQWLPYAQDHLDHSWPDRLRTWPTAWRNKPVAASALVRHLEVAGAQVKNMQQCIDALEADPPPLTGMSIVLGKDTTPLGRLLRAAPTTLEQLELSGPAPLEVVLQEAPLARLKALRIVQAPVDALGFGKVLDALGEPLRALAVRGACVMPDGMRRLVEGGQRHWERLVTLDLGASRIAHDPYGQPDYKHAGIRRLASVPWPALERLALSDLHLDDPDALSRLVATMPALRALDLSGNLALGSRDLVALFGALRGPLRELELFGCSISDVGMARLLGLEALRGLETLDLGASRVGRETALALRGEAGTRLKELTLTWSTHREAMQFAQALEGGALPALHTLGVLPNVEFVEAMARVELPSLRRLTHEHTGSMTPAVVEAVRRAPWGAQLDDRGDPPA